MVCSQSLLSFCPFSYYLAGKADKYTWIYVPKESEYGRDVDDLGDTPVAEEYKPKRKEKVVIRMGAKKPVVEKK
jgi:hypothetical protein